MNNYNNGFNNNNLYNNGNYMQTSYQQQNQYNPYNQQMYQPIHQQQIIYPLTLVNGIEGAKAYLIGLNQCVYLKDNDSDILYEKKTDINGKIILNAFELNPIDLENIGKPKQQDNNKSLDNMELVSKNDLKTLEMTFNENLINLSNDIKNTLESALNTLKKPFNGNNNGNKQNNNRK